MRSNKKMIFALGLIVGACLMLIFSFAVPGSRTYVGKDDTWIEKKMPQEVEERISEEQISIEEVASGRLDEEEASPEGIPKEIALAEDIPAKIEVPHVTESREVSKGIPLEEVTPLKETGKELSKAETIEQKQEQAVFQPIDDSHIPLKWEYKMKE